MIKKWFTSRKLFNSNLYILFMGILVALSFLNLNPPMDVSIIQVSSQHQLFVDDYLIERSTMRRVFHKPNYYPQNPILKADKPWELNSNGDPYAAPFSGGVWYDNSDQKFKMWYSAGGAGYSTNGMVTCYAESTDGKRWIKPLINAGTNIVDISGHDCVSVLLDESEKSADKRFKMFCMEFIPSGDRVVMKLKYSPDGIKWTESVAQSGEIYDRCSAYYDPFRDQYVLSLKTIIASKRARNYLAHMNPELLVSLAHKTYDNTSDKHIKFWFGAQDDDPVNPDYPLIKPQIYNHDAVAYESLLLGFFTIWQGPENDVCDSLKIQKRNEVLIGWSHDGFNWTRTDMTPFFPVSSAKEAWNASNIQSTCGNPIVVGDSLYFYMSGRYNNPNWDSNLSTGLATLRRDGFVSMNSEEYENFLVTKALVFNGRTLSINANVHGKLYAELLDIEGKVIPGFSRNECKYYTGNNTKALITWKSKPDLSELIGKPVKIRFHLKEGALYSFWISD